MGAIIEWFLNGFMVLLIFTFVIGLIVGSIWLISTETLIGIIIGIIILAILVSILIGYIAEEIGY